MSLFEQKVLKFKFDLGPSGNTFADGTKVKNIIGYRSSVELTKQGQESMGECHGTVFGLPLDTLQALTQIGGTLTSPDMRNLITVWAGSTTNTSVASLPIVFAGPIQDCWANIEGPDAPLVFTAFEGMAQALASIPPTSVDGATDVVQTMNTLADQMKLTFENESGVAVKVDSVYLSGSPRDQAYQLANQADINVFIEAGVLAIWPKNGPRNAPGSPYRIAADNGMIGYPTFTQNGIVVRSIFRPDILYGAQIRVLSKYVNSQAQPVQADGLWNMFSLTHQLDCEIPGGRWFSEIGCSFFGSQPPLEAAPAGSTSF